jgi:hypothetical protein
MLKKKIAKLEDVAENLRVLYKKEGDAFVLDLEGDTGGGGGGGTGDESEELGKLRQQLTEFRNTNISVMRERDSLKAAMEKFKDIDPEKWEEAKSALDTLNQLEEKDLIKGGKIDEAFNRRMATARQQWEEEDRKKQKRIEALDAENKKYKGAYSQLKVDTEVARSIQAVGAVKQGALDDVMGRARTVWNINDKDELEAKGLFNEDGEPMTVEEWSKHLLKQAPHLFEPGSGGGAGGGATTKNKTDNRAAIRAGDDGILRLNGKKDLDGISDGSIRVIQPAGAASDD